MRVEYINPFVESAYNILTEVLNEEVKRGDLYLKNTAMPMLGIAAIVGLAGDVEGRVLFDMSNDTGIKIASAMLTSMDMEAVTEINDMARATLTELANMITGQAVTKLHNLGFKFDLTPPAIFTGDNMTVSDPSFEALIVPMELPMGRIEINVAVRERT
ncbi:chemotaxis protein CheX [Alkalispirochaeta sphaeroplastigenens]|uniref:Chemotaxis protein CheX n=1 Tax=Alkalispirochaeta sphaeroplastigenens TaxID=1187066 RepID=A0A2S4JFS1_9SPIO|nr:MULTISPECIES: chemotaxis protein CheX [Alkalispirochaeta]POQ98260.1 chemotaxis protein CheX [Alkalispirochaeta sphaeroplastigenens]